MLFQKVKKQADQDFWNETDQVDGQVIEQAVGKRVGQQLDEPAEELTQDGVQDQDQIIEKELKNMVFLQELKLQS